MKGGSIQADIIYPDLEGIFALIILALPLLSFLILYSFGRWLPRKGDVVATLIMGIICLLALVLCLEVYDEPDHYFRFLWFSIHQLEFTISFSLNPVSSLLLVVVSLIAFLVHLYSIEYMEGKRNYLRYFPYLALFTFSMFGIILSDNILLTFIFWELVGFSSYLLIGFWFEKESANKAATKAFLFNRVGDFGFLVALLIIWFQFQTFELSVIKEQFLAQPSGFYSMMLFFTGLGLFSGTVGKSAQFPLLAWLPDAMEGPTPVSALIHAATMVAAGVYLLFKVYFLLTPEVLIIIAVVGAITSIMGAYAALSQIDIKKVLAFSTISQLGYMVMAMGVGAYDAALFHLLTHAFFKACLFLSAGAVIHAMHHIYKDLFAHGYYLDFSTLDMRLMGGFRKVMPLTFATYLVSALSLVGIPFFSGFLSKDAILIKAMEWSAAQESILAYLIPASGFITVFLTAFYMGRQIFLVFFNHFRLGDVHETAEVIFGHLKEVPQKMKIPLIILALLSLWPFYSVNPLNATHNWFMRSLSNPGIAEIPSFHLLVPFLTILLAGGGAFYAWKLYGKITVIAEGAEDKKSIWYRLSRNNFYLDKLIKKSIRIPVLQIADTSAKTDARFFDRFVNATGIIHVIFAHIIAWFDRSIVDGGVHLMKALVNKAGDILRSLQYGKIQKYLLAVSIILIIVLFLILI